MASMAPSRKFMQLFNALPAEGQYALVEKYISGLLDSTSHQKSARVLSAATRLDAKYKNAPKLDLKSKRKQVNWLFDELARDAKVSFTKERSNRDELLAEVLNTLTSWLPTIWSVVYEHQINFTLAHASLLFVADGLVQLTDNASLGGCKCTVLNLPIDLEIKSKSGERIKHFTLQGPQSVDRVLLWIWRDLFVTLLTCGNTRDKEKIPDMLEDIEEAIGVESLERLLSGGRTSCTHDDDAEAEEDDELDLEWPDDECFDTENSDHFHCHCRRHGLHWTPQLNKGRRELRQIVEDRLYTIFERSPTVSTYNSILSVSIDTEEAEERLDQTIEDIAGNSSDNLAAALNIHIANYYPDKIHSLLEQHSYLLRPRDSPLLQCAAAFLIESEFRPDGYKLLEKELTESMEAIYIAVRNCFNRIDDELYRKNFDDILKLKSGTPERKARVEDWVNGILSDSGHSTVNPLAFAALMMGMPMIPGTEDGDEAEMLGFVNLDQNDPELDDLREEYRPGLKARLEGWVQLATTSKKGTLMVAKLYLDWVGRMPWLRASDAMTEMMNKLGERPSKSFVIDALSYLIGFSKTQRKKINQTRAEKNKGSKSSKLGKTSAATAGTGTSSSAGASGVGTRRGASSSKTVTTPPAIDPGASAAASAGSGIGHSSPKMPKSPSSVPNPSAGSGTSGTGSETIGLNSTHLPAASPGPANPSTPSTLAAPGHGPAFGPPPPPPAAPTTSTTNASATASHSSVKINQSVTLTLQDVLQRLGVSPSAGSEAGTGATGSASASTNPDGTCSKTTTQSKGKGRTNLPISNPPFPFPGSSSGGLYPTTSQAVADDEDDSDDIPHLIPPPEAKRMRVGDGDKLDRKGKQPVRVAPGGSSSTLPSVGTSTANPAPQPTPFTFQNPGALVPSHGISPSTTSKPSAKHPTINGEGRSVTRTSLPYPPPPAAPGRTVFGPPLPLNFSRHAPVDPYAEYHALFGSASGSREGGSPSTPTSPSSSSMNGPIPIHLSIPFPPGFDVPPSLLDPHGGIGPGSGAQEDAGEPLSPFMNAAAAAAAFGMAFGIPMPFPSPFGPGVGDGTSPGSSSGANGLGHAHTHTHTHGDEDEDDYEDDEDEVEVREEALCPVHGSACQGPFYDRNTGEMVSSVDPDIADVD